MPLCMLRVYESADGLTGCLHAAVDGGDRVTLRDPFFTLRWHALQGAARRSKASVCQERPRNLQVNIHMLHCTPDATERQSPGSFTVLMTCSRKVFIDQGACRTRSPSAGRTTSRAIVEHAESHAWLTRRGFV
jgi:hypothetical protein